MTRYAKKPDTNHGEIREASLRAWEAIRHDEANPLTQLLAADGRLTAYLPAETIRGLMDAGGYVGTAAERARALADTLKTPAQ